LHGPRVSGIPPLTDAVRENAASHGPSPGSDIPDYTPKGPTFTHNEGEAPIHPDTNNGMPVNRWAEYLNAFPITNKGGPQL